jgi:DNA-binding transcriptional MocR family regulator
MALVKVTRNDRSLLHEQAAAQIRQAIGEAKPGERLPTARHLAAVMGVNTNTVLRGSVSYVTKAYSSSSKAAGPSSPAPPNPAQFSRRSQPWSNSDSSTTATRVPSGHTSSKALNSADVWAG